MSILKLDNITKIYGDNIKAASNISIDIEHGEFIALLGPSGCGKTTTLRMIAGLEEISEGELYLNEQLANDLSPDKRNLSMVFQDYALIPHMTVYNNIAYPLKIAKASKAEIEKQVKTVVEMVKLEKYLNKKPGELSGGQRQRVALARALVKETNLILMDEPLSNLDVELRASSRSDIIKINRKFGKTIIYVTHDQIEAMTMANRIVVLRDGCVQQIGSGKEIYHYPQNEFVAKFIGNPGMNIMEGNFVNGYCEQYKVKYTDAYNGQLKIGIRPEYCILSNDPDSANFTGELVYLEDYGNDLILDLKSNGDTIKVRVPNVSKVTLNETYSIKFIEDKITFFTTDGEVIEHE